MIFSNTLVAYDGSDHAKAALEVAHQFALADKGVRLTLLTIVFPADVDPGTFYDGGAMMPDPSTFELDQEMDKADQRHAREQLRDAVATLEGIDPSRITSEAQVFPTAAEPIADYAHQHGCDLIVMGRHSKRGILDFLGSTAKSVMRKTSPPRPDGGIGHGREGASFAYLPLIPLLTSPFRA